MSIALQRQGRMPELGIGRAAFVPSSAMLPRNKDVADEEEEEEVEGSDREYSLSPSPASSSSSSIGKDSDACGGSEEEEKEEAAAGENEVQSSFRGTTTASLDLDALEQSLPDSDWRKGLSKCYVGKAKSFSDLGKAESITDVSELEKTEHAVNKRRRNEIALTHVWDRSGISKRTITSCRSAISLAMAAMEGGAGGEGSGSNSPSSSRSPTFRNTRHHHPRHLPPLYPGVGGPSSHVVGFAALPSTPLQQRSPPMRSLSMADLHYFNPASSKFH